jgi:Ca-activated chloride channel family protein
MVRSLLILGAILVVVVIVGLLFGGGSERRGRPLPVGRRSPWGKRIAILLMVGAVVLLGLSFTQFRFFREQRASGTVVLAMDVSESMGRTDVAPNRLEAAKAAARAFLDELPPELRVGLVTFAGQAEVVTAPSTDRREILSALGSLSRSEGTVIGDGLSSSLDALETSWERDGKGPAVVVLLSDGQDTGSLVSPDAAAGRASDLRVAVYTVVLGPADPSGGHANAELMQRIADATSGSTFGAETAGGLLDVYRSLGTQLSTELGISDYGALFVGIAAVLAIVATGVLLFSAYRTPF